MNPYFFEIVRRAFHRYRGSCRLRRRPAAGPRPSHRDYRSPRKAENAVDALKAVVGDAPVVRAFDESDSDLQVATFEIVSGVVPLRVGSIELDSARRGEPQNAVMLRRQAAAADARPAEPASAAALSGDATPAAAQPEQTHRGEGRGAGADRGSKKTVPPVRPRGRASRRRRAGVPTKAAAGLS